jgi:hypothetical protein
MNVSKRDFLKGSVFGSLVAAVPLKSSAHPDAIYSEDLLKQTFLVMDSPNLHIPLEVMDRVLIACSKCPPEIGIYLSSRLIKKAVDTEVKSERNHLEYTNVLFQSPGFRAVCDKFGDKVCSYEGPVGYEAHCTGCGGTQKLGG